MKKAALILLVFIAIALNCAGIKPGNSQNDSLNGGKEMEKGHVMEIAFYSVKKEHVDGFIDLSKSVIDGVLSNFDGYVRSHTYRGLKKPDLFLDVVEWETLEKAKAAVGLFEKDARFKEFLNAIEETKYFGHSRLIENGTIAPRKALPGDQLEFVVSTLKDGALAGLEKSRPPLIEHIAKNYEEFKEITTLQSVDDQNLVIDLAFWSNTAICSIVQKEVESEKVYHPFISAFKDVLHMEYFKRVR